jgi:hypothetical protein
MVSRRKILSRSTDDLNLEGPGINEQEEEDVWFHKEKLYKVQKQCDQMISRTTAKIVRKNF